jgi:glutaredoxin
MTKLFTQHDILDLQRGITDPAQIQVYVFGYMTCPYSAKARGLLSDFPSSEWTFVPFDWGDRDQIDRIRHRVGNRTFPVVFVRAPAVGSDTYAYIGGASDLESLLLTLKQQLEDSQLKTIS